MGLCELHFQKWGHPSTPKSDYLNLYVFNVPFYCISMNGSLISSKFEGPSIDFRNSSINNPQFETSFENSSPRASIWYQLEVSRPALRNFSRGHSKSTFSQFFGLCEWMAPKFWSFFKSAVQELQFDTI